MPGMSKGSFNSTKDQRAGRGSGGITKRGFRPGQSGNPGGRPRQDVITLARAHTREAIEALVEALKRPKEAVPAAVALLNRGWGTPAQTIVTDPGNPPLAMLHLVAAKLVSSELQAELGMRPAVAFAEPQPVVDLMALAPPIE